MTELFAELYALIERRRDEREDGSYTAYLFGEGIDKILKKVGEESAETIIAAKNLKALAEENSQNMETKRESIKETEKEAREAFNGEVGDLLYHLMVLLVELKVNISEIEAVLCKRMEKTGNLKR